MSSKKSARRNNKRRKEEDDDYVEEEEEAEEAEKIRECSTGGAAEDGLTANVTVVNKTKHPFLVGLTDTAKDISERSSSFNVGVKGSAAGGGIDLGFASSLAYHEALLRDGLLLMSPNSSFVWQCVDKAYLTVLKCETAEESPKIVAKSILLDIMKPRNGSPCITITEEAKNIYLNFDHCVLLTKVGLRESDKKGKRTKIYKMKKVKDQP